MFAAALPAVAAPALTSITPTSGYPATQVTLNGTNFGTSQGTGSVWLGNRLAGSIVSWSNTQIVATAAATTASGSAQVQQGGGWSNSIAFTVITPNIASISPTSGYPGTQVTINGTNFGASQGSGSVWLGNKLAGSIVSWSDTQIVATVAATALSGSAQVQQNGVWGNSVAFAVITPNIASISPTSGYPGTQVTINGTSFGASQGSGSVWLGNKLAGSIVSWSNTQIVVTTAATAASGSAQVQQGGVWSNSVTFTVITPNIATISPTSGYPGTQVTLNGTNFGASQGSGSVWLGNKLAGSIVSWSNTQIVATAAATAASGSAQVQQGGVWSNSIAFTVITPNITSVSPTSGVAGIQVTFNGTNFGATQGSGSVWLGSKLAGSIVSWSNTQVVATVASGAASGSAQVQQGGVWSNPIAFTVLTPALSSASPTTTRAGDSITITGTNLGASQGSGSVWLGNKLAGSIVSWSATQIVATVASGAKTGSAQVQQGGVWSNAIAFTVITPVVSSLSPSSGPVGTQVTIAGTGFGSTQGSGLVWIGTKYATVVSWSDTEVVATVATDSETGAAQVFQNGVWSNDEVIFTVTVVPQFQMYINDAAIGGEETDCIVILTDPAPAGGYVIALSSSNTSVTVPASVTIPEGETFARFTITMQQVAAVLEVTISGTHGAATANAVMEVLPTGVQSISLDDSQLNTGQSTTAHVVLLFPAPAGGAVVSLASLDPTLLSVPASVTIPAGETETTFVLTVGGPLTDDAVVQFLSNYYTQYRYFEVSIAAPVVSLTLTPSTVEGGQDVTAKVTLSEPAAAGTTIHFRAGVGSESSFPPLTIATGATTGQFTFPTDVVMSTQTGTITALFASTSATAALSIEPLSVTLSSVTVDPSELVGSNPATLTVTLTHPAPAGGIVVELSGAYHEMERPPFVTVPEGSTSISVPVDTFVALTRNPFVSVGAFHGATNAQQYMWIDPPPSNFVTAFTLGTPRTAGGNLVTATVTLDTAAGSGGAEIALESSDVVVATVPASVTVAQGSTTAMFNVDTDAVTQPLDLILRATYNGVIRKVRLTVVPTPDTIALESLTLPLEVIGPANNVGTVTISSAAPAGGIVVALGGSRTNLATVPASVTIPEGETSATFTITTQVTHPSREILVTATYDNLVRQSLMRVSSPQN